MRIGYARLATAAGDIAEDLFARGLLEASSCMKPLINARDGDTMIVWKLDRLGRSLKHLIETVNGLSARKIGFQRLRESMDTTTSGGNLLFHVFGALAE